MASSAKLDIIVSLINEASSELGTLKKDLAGVGAGSEKASTSFKDVGKVMATVGGIAAATGYAIKKAFDFAETGAAVEQTRESFDGLGLSLDALKAASGGTVDEMTLMSGAMTLMAGTSGEVRDGLADAMPQLLEIAKAANKLNPSLGDTAFLFDSLANGVKRGSKLLIDNTGITFGLAEAYENYARQIGASADALTDEQKKMALLNQTLETGQVLIEQAGGTTEAQTDSYRRLTAQLKDLGANAAESADKIGGPLTNAMADNVANTNAAIEATGNLLPVLALAFGSYGDYIWTLNNARLAQEKNTETELKAQAATEGYAARLAHYNDVQYAAQHVTSDSAVAFDQYTAAIASAESAAGGYADEVAQAKQNVRDLERAHEALHMEQIAEKYDTMTRAMDSGLSPAIEDYNEKQGDLNTTLADLNAEMADLEGGHGRMVTIQAKSAMSAAELTLAQRQQADTLAQLNKAEEGSTAQAKLAVKYEDLTEKINLATGAQTGYVDNSKRMEEVQAEIDATIEKLAELEAEHTRQTGQILMNFAQQAAAADGVITDEELDYVTALGREYGLLDDVAVSAIRDMDGAMGLAKSGIATADQALLIFKAHWDEINSKSITLYVDTVHTGGATAEDAAISIDPGTGSGYNAAGGFIPMGSSGIVGDGGRAEVAIATPAGVRVVPTTTQTFNINNTFQSGTNPNQVIGMQMALYGGG